MSAPVRAAARAITVLAGLFMPVPPAPAQTPSAPRVPAPTAAATNPASATATQTVDLARSTVTVVARQMNVPFEGRLRVAAAEVVFDERRPEAARARVEVDLASFDLGDAAFNDEARGKSFLDAAGFPRASFVSSAVRSLGGDRYEAIGKLSIKGLSRDLTVPFTVRTEGGVRVFDARWTLRRLDWRIGDGAWADTKILADETQVQVRLVLASPR